MLRSLNGIVVVRFVGFGRVVLHDEGVVVLALHHLLHFALFPHHQFVFVPGTPRIAIVILAVNGDVQAFLLLGLLNLVGICLVRIFYHRTALFLHCTAFLLVSS